MIRTEGFSIRTPSGRTVLQPVDLEVPAGKVLGIFGPNGSGKSSLLRGLAGLLSGLEERGEVRIDGIPIGLMPTVRDRVSRVLYLGSDFRAPFDLKVRDLFELGAQASTRSLWPEMGSRERERVARVVEALDLSGFLSRSYPTLSDGERQWMMFARGLIQAPKILILDETFSKMDLDRLLMAGRVVRQWSAEEGMTMLIASHDLNLLSEISDSMLFLREGRVLARGPVEEVLTESNLRNLFERAVPRVILSPGSGKRKILY